MFKFKEYPSTDDLNEIGRRMVQGKLCIGDVTLMDGSILKNCLVWGHPNCYEIVKPPMDVYFMDAKD